MSALRTFRTVITAAALLIPALGSAQTKSWDAAALQLTREQLQELLAQYEQYGRSTSHSDQFKLTAKEGADLIRRRLSEGDFQVGDQIVLTVAGETLPAKLVVEPGRKITIPGFGELPLEGVLRSELTAKATEHIAKYVRTKPAVSTQALIRLSVQGQVSQPGFSHVLPAESIISDLITVAGGPAAAADMSKAFISRGNQRIWEGEQLQQAIADGRTLDQMQLRSGDQLNVPAQQQGGRGASLLRYVTIIPAIAVALTGLAALF